MICSQPNIAHISGFEPAVAKAQLFAIIVKYQVIIANMGAVSR